MKTPIHFQQQQTEAVAEQQEQAQEIVAQELEKAFTKAEKKLTEQGGLLDISEKLNRLIVRIGELQAIGMINDYCNQFNWNAEFFREEIDGGWSMTARREVTYHGERQVKISPR